MTHPHLENARNLSRLLDNQFSLFGIRFGLDTIIGFIPGVGDFITTSLALYLLWIGFTIKLPGEKLLQMFWNVLLDALIGSIPFLGDIGDLFFKANMRNLRILEEFADKKSRDYPHGEVIEGEVISE